MEGRHRKWSLWIANLRVYFAMHACVSWCNDMYSTLNYVLNSLPLSAWHLSSRTLGPNSFTLRSTSIWLNGFFQVIFKGTNQLLIAYVHLFALDTHRNLFWRFNGRRSEIQYSFQLPVSLVSVAHVSRHVREPPERNDNSLAAIVKFIWASSARQLEAIGKRIDCHTIDVHHFGRLNIAPLMTREHA